MTDDDLDLRLQAAGARWRERTTTPAAATRPDPAAAAPTPAPPPARRRHWGLIGSAAAVAAALVVGGTFLLNSSTSDPRPSGDVLSLEGHVWLLQDKDRGASTATMYIDHDGNLVADDECRVIGAQLAVDGDRITAGSPVVRYKDCVDQYGVGFYEDGTAVLTGSSTYRVDDDGLTLTTEHKTLRFTPAPSAIPQPSLDIPTVVGSTWALQSVVEGVGDGPKITGDPTLKIGDDGAVSGSDGCNTISGHAEVGNGRIDFGRGLGGTEKACPGDANTVETILLDTLKGKVAASDAGGRLVLHKGSAELVYAWQPEQPSDPAALTGPTWRQQDGATLTFADGSLVYQADCGTQTTTVTATPGVLTLGAIGGSQCDQSPFHSKDSLLWSIRGGQLVLGGLSDPQALWTVFGTESATPPVNSPLTGTTWNLDLIDAGGGRYRNGAPPADTVALRLADSGVKLTHECYTDTGAATVRGSTVTFGDLTVGEALPCPFQLDRDNTADLVDSIMHGTTRWTIDGTRLTITGAAGALQFVDGDLPTGGKPLLGTDWRLETAVDEHHEYAAADQKLKLTQTSIVAGDGVNTISGAMSPDENSLRMGQLAVTAVGSTVPDPVRDIVDAVFQQGDLQWSIQGDVLTITRGQQQQLIYRAHPAS